MGSTRVIAETGAGQHGVATATAAALMDMECEIQKIIGKEIKEQLMEKEGKLPDAVIACVGGGSNAIGAFYEFIPDKEVQLIGCEAAGLGIDTEKHAATIAKGTKGIFHGMKS